MHELGKPEGKRQDAAHASIEETIQIDFTNNSGIYEKVEEFYMIGATGKASNASPNTTAATSASSAPTPLLSINNAAPNVPIFRSGTIAAQQSSIFSSVISPNNMFARQDTLVNFAAILAFIPSSPKPASFASRSATKVAAPSTPSSRTNNRFSYSAMSKGEKKRLTKKVKISFSSTNLVDSRPLGFYDTSLQQQRVYKSVLKRQLTGQGSLNVYGTQNLKVADLSIAPENVGANTNNTALTIGEKAAMIIGSELGIKV